MMKTMFAAVIGVVYLAPFGALAQSLGCSGGFFFPCGTGYGAPREQLVVYSFGPGMSGPSYGYPNYYAGYFQPMYQPSYYQPSYQLAYQTYYEPAYFYEPSYYPHYSYGSYGPGQSYAPQPTGGTDFWGNQLCNWGPGYGGYPCDRDPHQWIFDPYTGTYY
jgi:hypothetical protein